MIRGCAQKPLTPIAPFAALIWIAAAASGQNRNVAAMGKTEWTIFNPVTQLTVSEGAPTRS
jgi:hypothetical protein